MESTETLPNGLVLQQDDRFFKLGQDSVLLSSFARPRRGARVLDLCCGTGALALLLWRPDLTLAGLEIQAGACALFARSAQANGIEADIRQGDVRDIRAHFAHGSFDYVVCNPPYFGKGAGRAASAPARRTARQDDDCSIEEVAVAASFVLHTGGKLALVYRPERLLTLVAALTRVRLVPKRLRFVQQNAAAAPSAVLVECRKGGSPEGLCVEPPLLVESEEYRRIYGK